MRHVLRKDFKEWTLDLVGGFLSISISLAKIDVASTAYKITSMKEIFYSTLAENRKHLKEPNVL